MYCTSNNWVNNKIILWNHREFSESLDDVMEFVEEKLVVIKSNNNNFAYIAYLCVFSCTVPLCNKQMCVSYSPYTRTGIPKSHVGICMSFECKLRKVWMKMLSKLKVTKVSQNLVCSNYVVIIVVIFFLFNSYQNNDITRAPHMMSFPKS